MTLKEKFNILKSLLCFTESISNNQINSTAVRNGMKQSNLSKQLKFLEETVGLKLYTRLSNGISPTQAGKDIFEIGCDLDNLLAKIKQISKMPHQTSGEINFWCGEGIGEFLTSDLGKFYEQYPEVCINTQTSLSPPHHFQSIDLAIIYQKPKFENITELFHGNFKFKLFASKTYLRKYGYPKSIKDLQENHHICTRNDYQDTWPEWDNFIQGCRFINMQTDSPILLNHFVKENIGIALIPTFIGQRDEQLICLDRIGFEINHPFWLISTKETKDIPKIHALIEQIKKTTSEI